MEVDDATLMQLLEEHGQDITTLENQNGEGGRDLGEQRDAGGEVVPLAGGWLRLAAGDGGDLVGQFISDPVEQHPVGAPVVTGENDIEELPGWVTGRRDLSMELGWWCRLLGDPERERYAVAVHRWGDPEPELVLVGLYPDVALCQADKPVVVFVEPHPNEPGRARARLLPVTTTRLDDPPRVLAEGPAGGVSIKACSVRRFVKVGHGVRSNRIWQIFDLTAPQLQPIAMPESVHDPDLFDVAPLEDGYVLIHAVNDAHQWRIEASHISDGQVQNRWRVAAGQGKLHHLIGAHEAVLARISQTQGTCHTEDLLWIALTPATTAEPRRLLTTPGMFQLTPSPGATSTGFVIAEMIVGTPPTTWYLDGTGQVLNPTNRQPRPVIQATRERITSPDGYQFDLDIRWHGDSATFHGPVIVMVYGAYGLDIDLDADPELGHWLNRGYAVATPHVRGGGDPQRHHAGSQDRRDRSLTDTVTAIQWLRSGRGAATATTICVIGASAGGFLTASLLADHTTHIDAAVIVNGYIDPLESLLHHPSLTEQADHDEWGDPQHNPHHRHTLEKLSPLRKLTTTPPPTLIAISAKDTRVNPRQGLTWTLHTRTLGGHTTLWYDPNGTHNTGTRVDTKHLINWVTNTLEQQ
ncbi:alpha/beta fold hydrolase [Arachnia propionica]|uniref:alpha/beta hydrolase family protein n=1 Tax=Arachnia propionica TaxID=1750 RepID=UPI0030CB9026